MPKTTQNAKAADLARLEGKRSRALSRGAKAAKALAPLVRDGVRGRQEDGGKEAGELRATLSMLQHIDNAVHYRQRRGGSREPKKAAELVVLRERRQAQLRAVADAAKRLAAYLPASRAGCIMPSTKEETALLEALDSIQAAELAIKLGCADGPNDLTKRAMEAAKTRESDTAKEKQP
jgi:hypothetical protein